MLALAPASCSTVTVLDVTGRTLDDLVAERAAVVARLRDLDAEIDRRGVRVTRQPSSRGRPASFAVLSALVSGPKTVVELRAAQGLSVGEAHAMHQKLHLLVKSGEIERVGHGRYALARPQVAEIRHEPKVPADVTRAE